MKRNSLQILVGLSLIWVPAVYCMSGDLEVEKQQLIKKFKHDPALPICIVAGFLQPKEEMDTTVQLLRKYVGTRTPIYVHALPDKGLPALKNVVAKTAKIINNTPDIKEVNLMGYSLGALDVISLIKLGLLKYQARTTVAIVGPLAGVKDFPYEGDDKFDNTCANINAYLRSKTGCCSCTCRPFEAIESSIHTAAYTPFFQKTLSVANLWHDPCQEKDYLEKNVYLPVVNNEVVHEYSDLIKQNFTTGDGKIIALAAGEDKTLETGQTGIWDFVKSDGKTYQRFEETAAYTRSGSRELTDTHRLMRTTIPGQGHGTIRVDEPTFIKYILPYLATQSQASPHPEQNFYRKVNL